jgi:hypothetical protein
MLSMLEFAVKWFWEKPRIRGMPRKTSGVSASTQPPSYCWTHSSPDHLVHCTTPCPPNLHLSTRRLHTSWMFIGQEVAWRASWAGGRGGWRLKWDHQKGGRVEPGTSDVLQGVPPLLKFCQWFMPWSMMSVVCWASLTHGRDRCNNEVLGYELG